jgi:hypothetical protein
VYIYGGSYNGTNVIYLDGSTGNAYFAGTLAVTGLVTASAGVTTTFVTQTGGSTSTFAGPATFSSTLGVTGLATLSGGVSMDDGDTIQWASANNRVFFNGGAFRVDVNGSQYLGISTAGLVTMPGTLNVTGATTLGPSLGFANNGALITFQSLTSDTSASGMTWYAPAATSYGIYKSAGSWSSPNYQQLVLTFNTGIIIDGGTLYGKSGTSIQPSGGAVTMGGTLSVTGSISANGIWYGNSKNAIDTSDPWLRLNDTNAFTYGVFIRSKLRVDGNIETNSGDYGYGLTGNYVSTRFRTVYAMGSAYVMATDGTSLGNLFGLFYAYDAGATAVTGDACGHGFGVASSGTTVQYFGDSGAWIGTKLKVKNNRVDIQGPGTTSSTYGLVVTSYGGASNNFWVRDDGDTYTRANATAADFVLSSDSRKKTNIQPIKNALHTIRTIDGIIYNSIDGINRRKQSGVIAQTINDVFPYAATFDGEYYGVMYDRLVPLLIEGVKDVDTEVAALKSRIEMLEQKLTQYLNKE